MTFGWFVVTRAKVGCEPSPSLGKHCISLDLALHLSISSPSINYPIHQSTPTAIPSTATSSTTTTTCL
jgi:hypothetical protein